MYGAVCILGLLSWYAWRAYWEFEAGRSNRGICRAHYRKIMGGL